MSTAVGETLPLAVAVALSPFAILAIILVLMSRRARSNGPAFLLGWIAGLVIAVGIALALMSLVNLTPGRSPETLKSLLKLVIGALLIIWGVRQWLRLPTPGQEPKMPRWMASIDTFTPARTFGLAALLSSAGNFAVIVAAAATISRAQLELNQEVGAAAIFVIIGSLLVMVAVIYQILARERASRAMESWKSWLITNNAMLSAAMLVVVGALLIGKGISGLSLLG